MSAGAFAGGGLLAGCSSPSGTVRRGSAPSPSVTGQAHGSVVTPFGRHLAFGADPKTQMRVSWQVPLAVLGRICGWARIPDS